MPYYVLLTSNPRTVKRVLKVLARHGDTHLVTVAIVIHTDRRELLGGIAKVGDISVVRGYLLPPASN